jgi:hypothetical protein
LRPSTPPIAPDSRGEPRLLGGTVSLPKNFQSFAEFEREIIRGSSRMGLSLEEMVEDTSFDAEIEIDDDPFESMRDDY